MRMVVRVLDERIAQPFARTILQTGLRQRRPALVALALVALTRLIRLPDTTWRRSRGRRLVVLHKLGGTEDLAMTLDQRDHAGISLLRLQRSDVKRIFGTFLPESLQLDDFDYRPADAEIEALKSAYRDFMTQVCRHYARWLGAAGFVTANIGYFAEREMATACADLGIPFIALHKECLRTPSQRPVYEAALRDAVGPFRGTQVAVYNDDEATSQIGAGIVDPHQITVVGCPRVDEMHALRGKPPTSPRPTIVYFTIDLFAGTRQFESTAMAAHTARLSSYADEQGSPPRWDNVAAMTERALIELAQESPDINFIFKVKLGRSHQFNARLDELTLPGNISIVHGGLAAEHISRASVAVGLNTTALLEAIAAGRHVVVPRFGEAGMNAAQGYLLDLDGVAVDAQDPSTLKALLVDYAHRPLPDQLTEEARRILDRYVGNADGRASDRTFNWLLDAVPALRRS